MDFWIVRIQGTHKNIMYCNSFHLMNFLHIIKWSLAFDHKPSCILFIISHILTLNAEMLH